MSETDAHTCSWCGRVFSSPEGLYSHRGHMHDVREELECVWCGETFEAVPNKKESRKTCSKACHYERLSSIMAGENNPMYIDAVDMDEVVRRYNDGLTISEVAESLDIDVSKSCLHSRMQKADVEMDIYPIASYNYRTANGEAVRSEGEQSVANWFQAHGVTYEYEPSFPGPYTPDFVVFGGDVVVEVWGWSGETYEKRRREKVVWYAEQGYYMIHVNPSETESGCGIVAGIDRLLQQVVRT